MRKSTSCLGTNTHDMALMTFINQSLLLFFAESKHLMSLKKLYKCSLSILVLSPGYLIRPLTTGLKSVGTPIIRFWKVFAWNYETFCSFLIFMFRASKEFSFFSIPNVSTFYFSKFSRLLAVNWLAGLFVIDLYSGVVWCEMGQSWEKLFLAIS